MPFRGKTLAWSKLAVAQLVAEAPWQDAQSVGNPAWRWLGFVVRS
jgi:hypothetical protein